MVNISINVGKRKSVFTVFYLTPGTDPDFNQRTSLTSLLSSERQNNGNIWLRLAGVSSHHHLVERQTVIKCFQRNIAGVYICLLLNYSFHVTLDLQSMT